MAGEPLTEDFLRFETSSTTGELVLDELDCAIELLLTVRSSGLAVGGWDVFSELSVKSGNQFEVSWKSPSA